MVRRLAVSAMAISAATIRARTRLGPQAHSADFAKQHGTPPASPWPHDSTRLGDAPRRREYLLSRMRRPPRVEAFEQLISSDRLKLVAGLQQCSFLLQKRKHSGR
jgi:hypothetical protein